MVSMRLTRLTVEPITVEVETVGRACYRGKADISF